MLVLVRRIRDPPTSGGFNDLSTSTTTTDSRCQAIDWVQEVGDNDPINYSCGTERSVAGSSLHLPTQKAQPDRPRQARQRVQIAHGSSDAWE